MDYITTAKGQARWDPCRFIAFRSGTYDPMNSYVVDAIGTLPVVGTYTVVDDANRPDMISAAIYNNDPQYWWLLMIFNGMWDYTAASHFIRIPVGTQVKYFSIDDLERMYFGLRAQQVANPA